MSKASLSRLLIALAMLAASPGEPAFAELAIHIHADKAMFQVLMSPGSVGTDSFVLQLMDGEGNLLKAKQATLTLSLPEHGIVPLERKATLGADGYWHVRDVPISYPGRWHVRVDALVTGSEKITLEDEFDVPAR
jgi:copper transport protein